jgi:hypothetical protein
MTCPFGVFARTYFISHIPQVVVFQIEFSDFEAILAKLVDIARSMTVIFDKNWGKLA